MISDEAVEAAMEAFDPAWAEVPGDWRQYFLRRTRAALEAAAPHMHAPLLALADERDETPGAIRGHVTTYELRQALKPYRSQA